jgi:hypothetical protein
MSPSQCSGRGTVVACQCARMSRQAQGLPAAASAPGVTGRVRPSPSNSSSYLWNSATWEISEALLTFLRPVMDGSDAWDANPTIRRAIEIREGVIQNPAILSFQGRSPLQPHWPLAT